MTRSLRSPRSRWLDAATELVVLRPIGAVEEMEGVMVARGAGRRGTCCSPARQGGSHPAGIRRVGTSPHARRNRRREMQGVRSSPPHRGIGSADQRRPVASGRRGELADDVRRDVVAGIGVEDRAVRHRAGVGADDVVEPLLGGDRGDRTGQGAGPPGRPGDRSSTATTSTDPMTAGCGAAASPDAFVSALASSGLPARCLAVASAGLLQQDRAGFAIGGVGLLPGPRVHRRQVGLVLDAVLDRVAELRGSP